MSLRQLALSLAIALLLPVVPVAQGVGRASSQSPSVSWLAAGDSYSSGEGLPHSTGDCALASLNTGSRTWAEAAYNELQSQGSKVSAPTLVACTGAKTSSLMQTNDRGGSPEWADSAGRFDLVTFTFGGDDIGFADVLEQCIGLSSLVADLENGARGVASVPGQVAPLPSDPGHTCPSDRILRDRISGLASPYRSFLTDVANRVVASGGNVVVLGYPDIVELPKFWHLWEQKVGSCWGIGTGDATELRGLAGELNATIGQAVSGVNKAAPNGVHFTFVDVNTGQPPFFSSDPHLFEPSSGARHNLCSADPWINGWSKIDYGTGSFHPKQAGLDNEGHLAASTIARLDWSHWFPSHGEAKAQLAQLAPGTSAAIVDVPPGYEAATWDAAGHITFWRYDQGAWRALGHSNTPALPASFGPPSPVLRGALLANMSDAVFIAQGGFTGDGSGDSIAFASGPAGWGTVAPTPNGTLEPTGHGSTDFDTPGLFVDMNFTQGFLETVEHNDEFDIAHGTRWALQTYWKWGGATFVRDHDNIFNAAAAPAPPAAPDLPLNTCPSPPPDGVYSGYYGAGEHDFNGTVDLAFSQNIPREGPGVGECRAVVDQNFPVTLQVNTRSGGSRWITAPIWLLIYLQDQQSLPAGIGSDLSTFPPEFFQRWHSPYFVLGDLQAVGLVRSGGAGHSLVRFQGGKIASLTVLAE